MADTYTRVAYDGVVANRRPTLAWLRLLAARALRRPVHRWHFHATLRGPDGVVKTERHYWNTVTSAGLNQIADQLLDAPSIDVPSHMAVGTGSPGATALGTELDRNALTDKTRSSATVTFEGDWAAGDATGALTEAGVFNAAASGDMTVSASFSVINKGANDVLSVEWSLEIT
jgi:hypothetical protein